ncbi:nucleotidyltransferase family protein [Shewanella acanthi]|uniref:nucleotidyltransferase family protein n=1 Tax=Shewanella acanthi TaxID=2864212 RepID=UPI001C65BC60|nr:nucleotidyltransferase family protein [Shewanella acanthi]QYJ80425.1 nucleotidyltransferase family protein [Shewanella acanthi]
MQSHLSGSNDTCVALVLAAGYGKRFGQDKRRTPMGNHSTLLGTTLASIQGVFAECYVVIRDDDKPEQLGITHPTKVIVSTRSHDGLGSSLAAGIEFLQQSSFSEAAIFLGDMPWIQATTQARLIAAARPSNIVLPTFRGKPGHPVIFGRKFWPELMLLDGDKGAKSIVCRHQAHCVFIPVKDPGILRDVDIPEDLGTQPQKS